MERKPAAAVRGRRRCLLLALLIPAAEYLWGLWYYGRLAWAGRLLSIAQIGPDTLPSAFLQHLLINLPDLLLLGVCAAAWKRDAPKKLGLSLPTARSRFAAGAALAGALAPLLFALLSGRLPALRAVYGWFYYLIWIAFFEELTFRAVLPSLVARSGLPDACVWLIPGVLFGVMHTLVPLITGGAAAALEALLSSAPGYVFSGCAFYALSRWTGTLWVPVLLHGMLDYLSLLA